MKTLKTIPFFAFIGLLPSLASAGVPGFNPIPKPVKPSKVQTLHVVGNGVACFTAPCPSYTAVTAQGEVIKLSEVILPEGLNEEIALESGGLLVEGTIKTGKWNFGGKGNVLKVKEVLDVAQTFTAFNNGIKCIKAPCPTVTALSTEGTEQMVSGIDFTALEPSPEEEGELSHQLLNNEIVVHGFIVKGSGKPFTKGTELLVTKVAAIVETFEVKNSGIVCVVAPCPVLSVSSKTGFNGLVDSLNLSALRIAPDLKEQLLSSLANGVEVKGFVSPEFLHPGLGTVLIVTGLL